MLLFLILAASVVASSASIGIDCPDRCGNVSIPYPFGIGPACSRLGFEITCNGTDGSSFTPYLGDGIGLNEVLSISLLTGQARIKMYIAFSCYHLNRSGPSTPRTFPGRTDLTGTPYVFSDADNKFVAVGCNVLSYIKSSSQNGYSGGCMSICDSKSDFLTRKSKGYLASAGGMCMDGVACCQSAIRKGISFFEVEFDAINKQEVDSNVKYPCSYALLADQDWINGQKSHFYGDSFFWSLNKSAEVVLDWAIRDEDTCEQAKKNLKTYFCLSNYSECIDSNNGPGYICNCSSGFQGNPYVPDGCQDINECDSPKLYPCYGDCKNVLGSYECSCPPGTQGNASVEKCGEIRQKKGTSPAKYVGGTVGSLIFLIVAGSFVFMICKTRKLLKEKEEYFRQNDGWMQLDQMKRTQGEGFRIFTAEEMEEATNMFDNSLVIGKGGWGKVYRGILKDGLLVAIKRSRMSDLQFRKEVFVNEMILLSGVNHKNIVKLLGCCLEMEIPLLVYEYVSNGTLFRLIERSNQTYPVSFGTRLRIASESAEALAYLHSAASPPIIHGDVKSSNILLDNNYMAKVSDFGFSKLVPKIEEGLLTPVAGTPGYMDPEYAQTGQLTEKSDVYSLGVVLFELLTGKKAVNIGGSENGDLASIFISTMRENRILDILDAEIIRGETASELIQEVAELSMSCLELRGAERPTMKEVAEKLGQLRRVDEQHRTARRSCGDGENLPNNV